jgi:hypothetical protein
MKLLFAGLILCLGALPAAAQQQIAFSNLTPVGFCQFTATGTAQGLAAACSGGIPAGSASAFIVVESANVRWRDDGTAPTTSVGMLFANGSAPLSYQGNLAGIQFIAVSGSPVVDVSFYRVRQ